MMKKLLTQIHEFLPLKIQSISWEDPVLHFIGLDWNFHTLSAWRVIKNNRIVCCSEDEKSDIILNFKDKLITSVSTQSTQLPIDLVFRFSDERSPEPNDYFVEFFSAHYLEPWILGLLERIVYVSSPSDPNTLDQD